VHSQYIVIIVNHLRYENKINHSNEEFNKKNKNKLKRKYKNAVEQEYLDIYNLKYIYKICCELCQEEYNICTNFRV
jgi:hypothetical protein